MAFSLWCCSVPMIWNFNDTHSTNGERRSYMYSVCGEAALCNASPTSLEIELGAPSSFHFISNISLPGPVFPDEHSISIQAYSGKGRTNQNGEYPRESGILRRPASIALDFYLGACWRGICKSGESCSLAANAESLTRRAHTTRRSKE